MVLNISGKSDEDNYILWTFVCTFHLQY